MEEKRHKELKEYLADLYPSANDDQIKYYIKLIEDNSSESIPPTQEMLEYVQIDRQIKELTKQKEDLKATIIEQKQRLGLNFQVLKIIETTRHDFSDEGFYEFVSTLVSKRRLNEMTIKTIDLKKFKELEAAGKVSYDVLPETLYRETKSYRLDPPRK